VPKGTSRDEATSNSEKIKPVALAVIELRLSEGIRQSVEIPLNKFFLNSVASLKAFWVDLKAFLGLVLPTPSRSGKFEGDFRVILLRGPRLLLRRPYYKLLLWFMMPCKFCVLT